MARSNINSVRQTIDIYYFICRIIMIGLFVSLVLFYTTFGDKGLDQRQVSGSGQCSDGEIRLEGDHQFEGQVQICENGEWTNICILIPQILWNASHGEVICRSLGYSTESVTVYTDTYTANSSQLHTVYSCNGKERNLTECSTTTYSFTCNLVGKVICTPSCSDFNVRLAGKKNRVMGLVHACYTNDANDSLWGPICADRIGSWTISSAMTVCKQLGLPTTTALPIQYENVLGPYSYKFDCEPPNTLGECDMYEKEPLCPQMNAGGVICQAPLGEQCSTGDVRLVNGYRVAGRRAAGRLEACFNGVWGTVCRLSSWTNQEAAVVCKQLGFNTTVPIAVTAQQYGIGLSTQPIFYVKCLGEEDNITQCMHPNMTLCSHADDAGVICEARPGSCIDGAIRLRNGTEGSISVSGFVQVCFTGLWGTVCSDECWDEVAASVACKQLGYEFDSTEIRIDYSIQSLLAGVNCSGSEHRLADCHHDGVGVTAISCPRAFITCTMNTPITGSPSNTESVNMGIILGVTIPFIILIIVTILLLFKLCLSKRNVIVKSSEVTHIVSTANEADQYFVDEKLYLELRNKNMIISKTQVHLSTTIGQGEYGLVYKGYLDTVTGTKLVAIKTSKALFSDKEKQSLMKEVTAMSSFEHVNVMSLIGICLHGEMPLLIMPYMANGNVLEYVRSNKEALMQAPENTRKSFLGMCHQITNGMQYLATHKFVHRDLAARNCMIDGRNVIKVADFGLSEDMYSLNYFRRDREEIIARDEKVPIRWMAPESIENYRYDESTDVWSFGVTCWEIFTCGSVPYTGFHAMSILQLLKTGQRLETPTNNICSDQIFDIMTQCWSVLPNTRPNFTKLHKTFDDILEQEADYLNLED